MNIGDKYKIIGFNCGRYAMSRLSSMEIVEGAIIEIEAVQPVGPITIKVNKSIYTLGRGLFDKLILEKLDK